MTVKELVKRLLDFDVSMEVRFFDAAIDFEICVDAVGMYNDMVVINPDRTKQHSHHDPS